MKKTLTMVLALALVFALGVGGTLAWLTDETAPVQNTFTPSDIDITLTETKPAQNTAKMVPGHTIEKDPVVTVVDGSEDCYIFVKVVENNNTISGLGAVEGINGSAGKVLLYTVDGSWTKLTTVSGVDNVYYQVVTGLTAENNTANWSDTVITDNKVVVNQNVTKEMMNKELTNKQPALSFIAAAIQLYDTNVNQNAEDNKFTPAEAYQNLAEAFKVYPATVTP